ncbi:phosphoribosyl-AMP cyclohydrolase [Alienimonas californiensis]|uniref:Phosphoribosyl-AMP cyclohydrolase n=1 Tax=Alienimonas californiensis TaxID=2527989 RepID=A0A517PBS6_9PLAN|nr:phosphoribosyl-AMP cyclohydrolase [Alienimonas californiensis]QDT16835.1 phosphoribosyl-AMP cyclohydrolase [Alienimonas californiensis]
MTVTFAPRGSKPELEAVDAPFAPKFDADGLIPAIAVDAADGTILMQAYMNADSLAQTLEKGEAVYWSRSRQELWHKGATSGQVQTVVELLTDCDQDSILLRVNQAGGGACHTGQRSCFYRKVPVGQGTAVSLASSSYQS